MSGSDGVLPSMPGAWALGSQAAADKLMKETQEGAVGGWLAESVGAEPDAPALDPEAAEEAAEPEVTAVQPTLDAELTLTDAPAVPEAPTETPKPAAVRRPTTR